MGEKLLHRGCLKPQGRTCFSFRPGPLLWGSAFCLTLLFLLGSGTSPFQQRSSSPQAKRRDSNQLGHTGGVTSVAFSPDGRWLASGSADTTVRLWEVPSGRQVRVLVGHTNYVETIAFSPDGRWLASSSLDGTARVWEVSTAREVRTFQHNEYVVPLAISPDGRLLATACGFHVAEGGCSDPAIKLWNFTTGEMLRSLSGHRLGVRALAFSPDGRILASTGEQGPGRDSPVRLWEPESGREVRMIPVATGEATALAFSRDGKWLAGQSLQVVHVWEVATGQELHSLRQPYGLMGVAFSPDGNWLASTGNEPSLTLWDLKKWVAVHRKFDDTTNFYRGVAFTPDGRLVAVASGDNTVKLFNVPSLHLLRILGHPGPQFE